MVIAFNLYNILSKLYNLPIPVVLILGFLICFLVLLLAYLTIGNDLWCYMSIWKGFWWEDDDR